MSLSFLSKSNPLISNVKKGKFLTPWFLSPFILYYITQYMSPIRKASTDFFLDKQSWIPDWWNILDLLSFLYTIIAFFLWVRFIEKRPIRTMGFSKGNGLSEFTKGVLVGAIMITTVLVVFFITGDAKFDRIQFSLRFLDVSSHRLYFANSCGRNLYPRMVGTNHLLPQKCLFSDSDCFNHVLLFPFGQ